MGFGWQFDSVSRYSPGFLASGQGNDQYTKILLHMDGANGGTTFTDSNLGGSAHTWTAHSATTVTSGPKFGTASCQCPYIDTPDSSDFTLGSGDWTIDFWFNPNATINPANAAARMAGQTNSTGTIATTSAYVVLASIGSGNYVLELVVSNGTTLFTLLGTTAFTSASSGWHHAELCRSGNNLKLFLDGVQEGGDLAITGTVVDSSNNFSVGRIGEVTSQTFAGLIDEFRLSVGIARHTANFTPPTAPYGP